MATTEGAEAAAARDAATGRGFRLGAALGLVWLVYLVYPVASVWGRHPGPLRLAATLAAAAIFAACYAWIVLRGFRRAASPARLAALALMTAIAILGSLTLGGSGVPLFIYVSVAAAGTLPPRAALAATAALAAAALALARRAGLGWLDTAAYVVEVGVIGASMVGLYELVAANVALRRAREEVARLAVAEERLRFARDLHDLLGHSLSLIALKSELAGRLLPAAPERAAAEIADVERVAREALREVREAVSGYRQPELEREAAAAREALAAAGIACAYRNEAPPLPLATQAVLAWGLREGVTNVLRHSRASRCAIVVAARDGWATVEVVDDGRGGTAGVLRPGRLRPAGSGLAGLAERAAAHGGRLEAGPLAEGGFRLCVAVPLPGPTPEPSHRRARQRAGARA